jgi:hypothetical protein
MATIRTRISLTLRGSEAFNAERKTLSSGGAE